MHTCYTHSLTHMYSSNTILLYYTLQLVYYMTLILPYTHRLEDHQHYTQPCRRTDRQCPIRIPIHRPLRPYLLRQTCCTTGTILHFATPLV